MLITATLLLMASMDIAPAPAAPEEGPESVAAHYFAPPTQTDAVALISEPELAAAGPISLSFEMREVEQGLKACTAMRTQMETLLGDKHGSYSVHPDWVEGYQNCLLTRYDEILTLGDTLMTRETELISGQTAEDAVRTADAMAHLKVYQLKIKRAVFKEVKNQKDFVVFYNTGSTPHPDAEQKERAKPMTIGMR